MANSGRLATCVLLGVLLSVLPGTVHGQSSAAESTAPATGEPGIDDLPYEVLLLKGNLARGKQEFVLADGLFREAATREDATAKVFVYWSRTNRERGDLNRAQKILKYSIRKFPENPVLQLEMAYLMAVAERWDELADRLAGLPPEARSMPFAHYLHGLLARSRGELEAAQTAFARAATASHLFQAASFAELAAVEKALGNMEVAISSLERAIDLTRSSENRRRYQDRLESYRATPPGPPLYTLRYFAGMQYDSNVNLAPLLFTDTTIDGGRASIALIQRLNAIRSHPWSAGAAGLVNQTLHAGHEQSELKRFNATLFNGELFVNQHLTPVQWGIRAGYDSIFLFGRPSADKQHFSERFYGGPNLVWRAGNFGLRAEALAEVSRYYADNPGGINDRASELADLRLTVAPRWRRGIHRLNGGIDGLWYDAEGNNFDNYGASVEVRYGIEIDPWSASLGPRFEARNYPNSLQGRADRIVTVNLGGQHTFSKRHVLGVVFTYEENIGAGGQPEYEYRRYIAGITYQGLALAVE